MFIGIITISNQLWDSPLIPIYILAIATTSRDYFLIYDYSKEECWVKRRVIEMVHNLQPLVLLWISSRAAALSDSEDVRISLFNYGHNTWQMEIRLSSWKMFNQMYPHTQHGKVYRRPCQGPHWYQQSGGHWFLRALHSIPTQICEEGDSCRQWEQAWLIHFNLVGTFSASRSSPKRLENKALTFTASHCLQGRFITQGVFTWLHDERKPGGDRFIRFYGFWLLSWRH